MAANRSNDELRPVNSDSTGGDHFPTVREFLASHINIPREVTIQPLSDSTLQPTRPIGALNLRERLLNIFQDESERACKEDPHYRTFTLKGRLSLTINGAERVFIEINDSYPHGKCLPEADTQQIQAEIIPPVIHPTAQALTNNQPLVIPQNYDISGQAPALTVGFDQSLIDRVTSLGQLELLRRYNISQVAAQEVRHLNSTEAIRKTSVFNEESDRSQSILQPETAAIHPSSISVQEQIAGHPETPSSISIQDQIAGHPETPSSISIQDQIAGHPETPSSISVQEQIAGHPETPSSISVQEQIAGHSGASSRELIPTDPAKANSHVDASININIEKSLNTINPGDIALYPELSKSENFKCYLCEVEVEDRMSLLLHMEKHCQILAQKCQQDKSPNTLISHLKESLEDSLNLKSKADDHISDTKQTSAKKSSKSPRTLKSKTTPKSPPLKPVEYIDDFEEEDNVQDSFSDDERNDPSFTEECISNIPPKRKHGPSTRSKSKASPTIITNNRRKSQIPRKAKKVTETDAIVSENVAEGKEAPIVLPQDVIPPKKYKHTSTVLAPFKSRPIKTKAILKRGRSITTPKMTLKIRMKEKAKALAIKAANEALYNPNLECVQCNKKFENKKSYLRHARRHNMKKCQCDVCGKSFSTLDSLSHHQRGLHSDVKPYSCEDCGQTFSFHHSYKLHRHKHSGSRPYKCDHCDKSYLTSSHLKAHRTAVHSQGQKDKFICSICGKSFNYQNSLRTHQMIHSGERPHTCSLCQKGFVSRQALRTHEMSFHVTSKNYKCDICNKFYKSEMLRNVHKRRHTSDVSRFMCDICGRQFMFKSNLEAHKYVHQEGRPFGCDTCGKAFKCMSSLYTHQYTHKLETPFLCKLCGKAFKTKNCCKAHERRHTAEKSFICPTCGSCFPDKGGLSKHIRTIHNPHKHFVCKLCNKVGTRADNMRTHVKSHGKDIGTENVENFIVEVLNPEGIPLTDQVVKGSNHNKQGHNQNSVIQPPSEHQPVPTINYTQLDIYQPPSVSSHLSQTSLHGNIHDEHNQHMLQQHFSSHSHGMVNLISQNQSHASHGHAHAMTPPLHPSNNSVTSPLNHPTAMSPPNTHSVTPAPQVPQSLSPTPVIMQMNPSYTTLHPLSTETMVMGGAYQPIYAPYKHQ